MLFLNQDEKSSAFIHVLICVNQRMCIQEIKKLVGDACKKDSNFFNKAWEHHILPVVKYSKILAKKLNSDEEIVEIAAWLHDYASVLDKKLYPEHHIYGAMLAEEILEKYNYPTEKIEKLKHCIYAHRGSKKIPKKTIEAKIIASADAMTHFDNVNALLYLAFVNHKMNVDEGTKWVLDKLKRSWNKLMPEAKEIIRDKYKAIKNILIDKSE